MIALLILVFAAVLVWLFVVHLREPAPPVPPPPPPVGPPGRRFSGRTVPAPAPPVRPRPAPNKRLGNGKKISASRGEGPLANGRTFTPENAIGLGCLRPISECTLGARCVCRAEAGQRRSGL